MTVIAAGLAGQIGIKAESSYGTAVTVDRFYEFNTEGLEADVGKLESKGIGTGRFLRTDRVKTYIKSAKGPIEMDVLNKSFGLWFKHMLGADTITGGSADKTHTCAPDALAKAGLFLTVQKGVPSVAGVSQPFTFKGGKITEWELKCAIDEILRLSVNLDFATVVDTTSLASASYVATTEPLIFTEGAITIGGSSASVKGFSIKGNDALNTERRFIGNVKKEPLANGIAEITGSLDMEFEDLTRWDAWVAGTQAALVLTFTAGLNIPTTSTPYSLTITIPKIEYSGESPKIGGPGTVMQGAPFRGLYDGSNAIITLAYVTSDTAA